MINKKRKEIKSILKRLEKLTPTLITFEESTFRITKITDNKYIVSNVLDPLFFDMYKEVTITKHNLINMLVNEIERR